MVVLVSIWVHLALSMLRLNAASRFFRVRWLRLTCLTVDQPSSERFGVVLIVHHDSHDSASGLGFNDASGGVEGIDAYYFQTHLAVLLPVQLHLRFTDDDESIVAALFFEPRQLQVFVGRHLQYGEIAQVTGDGMGVSVPAKPTMTRWLQSGSTARIAVAAFLICTLDMTSSSRPM